MPRAQRNPRTKQRKQGRLVRQAAVERALERQDAASTRRYFAQRADAEELARAERVTRAAARKKST